MPGASAMKEFHTHYDNLKVTRDAPPEVIRAAYRSLCHKFHPDRHGGSARATRTFQLINCAYAVLSDAQQRQQHDDWIARQEASAAAGWDGEERRRHVVAARGGPAALFRRWRSARTSAMWWTSAAALGAMMFMLYAA